MGDQPVLVCVEGALRGQVIRVVEGGTDIGRAPDNDVVLDDPDASRFHAHLLFDNGSLWLRDAGSRNGISVNGKRLREHRALKVGDTVQIGGHAFEVRWEEPEAAPEPEPEVDTPPKSGQKGWRFWPFSSSDRSE